MSTDPVEAARNLLPAALALRDEIDQYAAELRHKLSDLGPQAISATFGDDGILMRLAIDDAVRRHLTEEQLLEQIGVTLLGGPIPRSAIALVTRSLEEPDTLRPTTYRSGDGHVTVTTIAGRATTVRTSPPTWLLFEPSEQLAARVVALARQAADDTTRQNE